MIAILLYVCLFPLLECTDMPEWHMKPIGSHVKPDAVDEVYPDSMITTEDFANKYVLPRKPIVFRDVVKTWPAFTLWTDEYITEKYGDLEVRLEAKNEKRGSVPKGDVCLGRDTLRKFLKDYQNGADKYIVSELPTPMWGDVHVPPPMACGQFLNSYVEIDLWVNSDTGKNGNGGNSILHKDAFNTVNCVVNGSKEWKLIELQYNDYVYQSWEGPMDAGYGGFSLVNPDKVDASEFPDIGKIPRWQFVTVNAGDCLFLPSQMWHQVKSYGVTNRAVAFLFSKFEGRKEINATGCIFPRENLLLSSVDVDLQYPGKGIMTMGNDEIEATREELTDLINERTDLITKKSTYKYVYSAHEVGKINKKVILEKARKLYKHLLTIAGGEEENMTTDLIKKLSRDEIRVTFNLIRPIEPASNCNFEYSHLLPEDIKELIYETKAKNDGKLEKEKFMVAYEAAGGTHSFAESFWKRLAGEKLVVEDLGESLDEALEPYEEHRKEDPETEHDDESTITTPQGHVSQPKKKRGGYVKKDDEGSEKNMNDINESETDDDEEDESVDKVDIKEEL